MRAKTGYTVLGWVVWRIGSRLVKQRLAKQRVKMAAAAAIAAALAVGIASARSRHEG
jgi:hypothetical protein